MNRAVLGFRLPPLHSEHRRGPVMPSWLTHWVEVIATREKPRPLSLVADVGFPGLRIAVTWI